MIKLTSSVKQINLRSLHMRETIIINQPSEAALDKIAELQYRLSLKYGKELMKKEGKSAWS